MRVLFDVTHPAHVLVMRPMAEALQASGAEILFAARAKDLTVPLLEESGLPAVVVSSAAQRRSRRADARELAARVRSIRNILRSWRPEVLLTRNPSGVLAGLGTSTQTVFDTDDGRSAGLHYRLAAPFADIVTSSIHDPEAHGPRHLRYPAIKPHAFLHPDRFSPDPSARRDVGIDANEPLHVVRWSQHDASHDRRVTGMSADGRARVVALLRENGAVLESIEGARPQLLTDNGVRSIEPSRLHDLLATAACCVTDGQSVASEAAVLGVPCLRLSGFTGRVWYLSFLEKRELIWNYSPREEFRLLADLAVLLTHRDEARAHARRGAEQLNSSSQDLARWFTDLLTEIALKHPSTTAGEI